MNFKIGDVAIVTSEVAPDWACYIGTECVVTSTSPDGAYPPDVVYVVRTCDGLEIGAGERHLRRKPPADDSRSIILWADCPWQPERVTVERTEP